jgi:uncharacterized membrane-anchored protein YhcB (DUF1043 family)
MDFFAQLYKEYSQLLAAVVGVIFGTMFSLLSTWWLDKRRERKQKKRDCNKAISHLGAIITEVERGYERCFSFADRLKKGQVSLAKIYTHYWDSFSGIIIEHIDNAELHDILHKIYYYFELVNFNIELNERDTGAGFARDYYGEINGLLQRLKEIHKGLAEKNA